MAPKRADFIYDAASRLQNLNTYAAVTTTAMVNSTTYTVDPSGRLTYLSHFQPGTSNTILYGWGYDRSNRVTSYSRNDTGGLSESQTYNYDDAGQLTGSTGTLNENYTYDANGNRTNTGYSTPAGSDNRLATDGTYSYAYDAEGNLILRTEVATPGNARVFEYDYRNRLIAVRDYTGYVDALNPGTLVMEAEYTYDVNNLRIKKVVDIDGAGPASAVTTGFVYDQGHVVLQFDGTAGMTNRYLYGPAVDQVLADERASGVLWALADNLGSVRDLVDSGGTPVNHVKYSAFGEKVFESAPATNFLFGYTGAVFDAETNLGYHRARYLDHATGRWINQDPIGFAGDPSNLYRYVENGPTNSTDPSGLISSRANEGKFTIHIIPDVFNTSPLNSDVDVQYHVTVYDKIIYSKIELRVYVRTLRKNFAWGIGGELLNRGEEKWHRDHPVDGQHVAEWPKLPAGPLWTDNPGMTLYRGLNLHFSQEWRGEAWGLSKCDGQWHKIKEARWGHSATLSGGRYKIKRWSTAP